LLHIYCIVGTIFGILGWTLEFTVESTFKVVDGLSLLLDALYHKLLSLRFPTTENQNDQSANLHVLTDNRAGPSNARREIVHNCDNDYDSSSDDENWQDEPTSPEDVTCPCDSMEPGGLDENSTKGLKKSLQKNITKSVTRGVERILKTEINSRMQENMEILRNELKETIREDLARFKDNTIQDLKTTNRELLKLLVSDLKSSNEALVNKSTNELTETHQAIMKSFKDEISSIRQILLSEIKSSHPANTQTLLTSPETRIETDKYTDEKAGTDESDSLETTHVQAMNESRSGIGLERFQRTSNLVVLFTRSTNPSNTKSNDNDRKITHLSAILDPTLPQDSNLQKPINESLEKPQASFQITEFPQRPSISANLLDVEDESDDDFKETIVVPKHP